MVFHDNNLWIFGGRNLKSTFNDFWRFDLANGEWTQILSQNMPDPRRSHSMIVYGRLFWMFGGIQDVTKEKNDINIYSSSENLWTKIMNSSNLVYECSPTMKNKKGNSSIKAVTLDLPRSCLSSENCPGTPTESTSSTPSKTRGCPVSLTA